MKKLPKEMKALMIVGDVAVNKTPTQGRGVDSLFNKEPITLIQVEDLAQISAAVLDTAAKVLKIFPFFIPNLGFFLIFFTSLN